MRNFARSYADAWCSHDPAKVASHYVPGGTIAINGGEPTEIMEVARSFISAFPDIRVFVDDLIFKDDTVEFRWTFTGTNTGPGGTGKWVRIPGFEELAPWVRVRFPVAQALEHAGGDGRCGHDPRPHPLIGSSPVLAEPAAAAA